MDVSYTKDRRLFSITGFAYLLIMVISVIGASLLYLLMARMFPAMLQHELTTWIIGTCPTYAVALLVGRPLMKKLDQKHLYKSGMSPGCFVRTFCVIIFLTYIGSILGNLLNSLLSGSAGFSIDSSAVTELVTQSSLPLVFLFAVIIGPVFEELIFRKMLIDRMIVFGDGAAILLSAVIFALVHGNISQGVYGFLVGWVLGYVYVRTGRITLPIALHMMMNFFGSVLPLAVEQIAGYRSPAYWIYLVVICVLFVLGIVFFLLPIVRRRIVLRPGERSKRRSAIAKAAFGNPGIICFIIAAAVIFLLNAYTGGV